MITAHDSVADYPAKKPAWHLSRLPFADSFRADSFLTLSGGLIVWVLAVFSAEGAVQFAAYINSTSPAGQ